MPKVLESHNPVGEIKALTTSTIPDGFLLCVGQTLGSSSSGSSNSGQTYYDLYSFLWTNYTNSQLVIQTSAGAATTRGVSALADWTANKRMPTPNLTGRSLVGSGTFSDTDSGNSTSRSVTHALGDSKGAYWHTLTSGQSGVPAHSHGITDPGHNHNFTTYQNPGDTGGTSRGYNGATASRGTTTETTGISINNNATANAANAHPQLAPSHVTNWIIRY